MGAIELASWEKVKILERYNGTLILAQDLNFSVHAFERKYIDVIGKP